ncbi:MAG: S24 family peptidase [Pedobacter sp.]
MIKQVAFLRHLNQPNLNVPVKNRFDDLEQRGMLLHHCLVNNPSNTIYFEVDNDHMKYFGIIKGSIVVVDKSIEVKSGKLIFSCIDDEWMVRKLCTRGNSSYLCINNNFDACINVTGKDIKILGVVTWSCQPHNI